MSCILRVNGEELDVKALLAGITLKPDNVWHKGEPRSPSRPSGRLNQFSGVSFVASDADFSDFDLQLREATAFLEDFRGQIEFMVDFDGVDEVILDFGIEPPSDAVIHSDILTPGFLRAAADAKISVELSHYPISEGQLNESDGGDSASP